jgi:hypothetical protein
MHDNISYIEDEVEIARRSMPPPPAEFLAPPAFLETAQDKEERQRQQKLLDEARKRKQDKYEAYQDDFAKDFPKGIAAHFAFLQGSIVTDLERTIQNISPPTTNVMAHYRAMKERLLNKFGPNSQKDAEETRRKLDNLHGDHRGWDVYLAALDSLIEVLTQTPVRDTANNPIMEPVPSRPHLPVPHSTAPLAEFVAYAVNDANDRAAWDLMHPIDKILNHRPTDTAIKNNVMLALGSSTYAPYSILAQRYRQTDHANKTWTDLRQDIELIITNNNTGTSRDPGFRQRDRHIRDWRPITLRPDNPPSDSRASRTLYTAYHDAPSSNPSLYNNKRTLDHPQQHTSDVRAATPTSGTPSPATKNAYPCSNCGADHRSVECDNPKCFICQVTFPSPAARQAHYLSIHKRDSKRARFGQDHTSTRSQYTPPTSPFLSRSVEDMHNPSPYDSGYDSTYSRASGPGNPPSSHGNSDIDDQADRYIRDQRVATLIINDEDSTPPALPTTVLSPESYHTTTHRDRNIALAHRLIAQLPAYTRNDPRLHASALDYISVIAHSNPAYPVAHIHPTPVAHNTYPSNPSTPSDTPPPLVEDSSDDSSEDASDDASPPPPLHTLTDDEWNTMRRHGRILIPRPRTVAPGHVLFDIRTATHTSDSTASCPDPSDDEDYPPYWPAYEPPSPPRPSSPTPCDITTAQLTHWTTTQLEWHTFRRRIPELSQTPDELCSAPPIHRDMPNREFMWQYEGSSPDTVNVNTRILGYLQSRLPSWTVYLRTLPPTVRRHYLNMPPTIADLRTAHDIMTRKPLHQPPPTLRLEGYTHQPNPPYDRNGSSNTRSILPNPNDPIPDNLSSDLDNSNTTAAPATYPQPHTKNPRPRPSSDSDDEQQLPAASSKPPHKLVRLETQPPTLAPHSRQPTGRSRIPVEDIALPQLTPTEAALARAQLNASVQRWYRKNPQAVANQLKDPAEPHPDDLPTTTHSSKQPQIPPTSGDASLGGYPNPNTATEPLRNTPLPRTRPTLQSILKQHKHPTAAGDHSTQPPPHYRHQFQPILSPQHTVITRPYIPAPRPRNVEGSPWCDCCTAQLSDDDTTQPGLRDPSIHGIRYKLRQDDDQPPSHSNQHSDFIRLFRANTAYHDVQRDAKETYQARTGILPDFQATSAFTNTPDIANLGPTIGRLQYERYRARGGRQTRGPHQFDHSYNSPNIHNMTPGEPYRQWFHANISRTHYSLGEATNSYTQWLTDPQYGPNPTRRYNPPNRTPTPPPSPHHTLSPPQQSLRSPQDTPPPDPYDSTNPSSDHHHVRTQTIDQDVHISPDDSNAVLDSGAMMTTAPRRLLLTNPEWEDSIRPAPPGTAIRYGNMETEPVEEVSTIGSYPLSIVPNRYHTALVCVHDIVSAGHVVTFTNTETIVSDVGGAYTLRIPRIPTSREWRVPLHLLQRLTDLRASHPLHQLQPHHDTA